MWDLDVRNQYFAYKMGHSHMKINFTNAIFISRMELQQFAYEILFSYVKLHVKFLELEIVGQNLVRIIGIIG